MPDKKELYSSIPKKTSPIHMFGSQYVLYLEKGELCLSGIYFFPPGYLITMFYAF